MRYLYRPTNGPTRPLPGEVNLSGSILRFHEQDITGTGFQSYLAEIRVDAHIHFRGESNERNVIFNVDANNGDSSFNVSVVSGQPLNNVFYDIEIYEFGTTSTGALINSASNVNVGGVGVFKQETAGNLEFRGINAADAKITVALDAPNNEIDVGFGSVALNDLSNVNTAPVAGHVLTYVGPDWQSAPAGGGGEANTASNQGTGIGVFKQKTGVDLEFYTINQGSGIVVSLQPDGVQLDVDDQIPAFNSVPNSRISNPGFGYGTLVSPVTLLVVTPVLSNIWAHTAPPNWTLNSAGEVNRANWRLDSVPTGVKAWNIQAVGTIINNVGPALTRSYNLGFTRNGTYLQDSRQAVSVAFNENKSFALQWVGSIAINDKIEIGLMGRSDSVSVLIALCNFNIFPII